VNKAGPRQQREWVGGCVAEALEERALCKKKEEAAQAHGKRQLLLRRVVSLLEHVAIITLKRGKQTLTRHGQEQERS